MQRCVNWRGLELEMVFCKWGDDDLHGGYQTRARCVRMGAQKGQLAWGLEEDNLLSWSGSWKQGEVRAGRIRCGLTEFGDVLGGDGLGHDVVKRCIQGLRTSGVRMAMGPCRAWSQAVRS